MFVSTELKTPLFERGRPDRMPLVDAYIDTVKPVNRIRVRVFEERKMFNITGI